MPSHAVKPAILSAELRRSVLEVRRDAEAVGLLVVQDEHLLDAERLRQQRVSGALVVVSRHDADVVALPGRVVLARLTGHRARAPWVRPTYVFAGLTIAIGPFAARLSTGTMISAQPELNVPITPTTLRVLRVAFAFAEHLPESHLPAWAVASSQLW